MRRWLFWFSLFLLFAVLVAAPVGEQARTRVAEGFDQPVGKPDAEGYYMSRGFLPYHPGEDWNGLEGGNTDLGKPVYVVGNGYVTYARDARMGWGNVVLVRHVFVENGQLQMVDSMYAHLDRILVREGQQVIRGQQVGTIGTNRGMYTAHLHFEIRKNLRIGINRSAFPKDFTHYYRPGTFIAQHRILPGRGRSALVPLNTYGPLRGEPVTVDGGSSKPKRENATSPEDSPFRPKRGAGETTRVATPDPTPAVRKFRVNRFEDF